ncbi:hypothetical protein [Acinetobacter baumannii]|uniref:hypothetical protein n=1 Tax=Acinetobacter baumannii TaxID=470 RepID=UPI0024DE3F4C|nr:hypothetical protein [Acinetobacter baumannii]MDK2170886.1 hypothetical protein [Acinetobacter baumannii]MDK2181658.1 hypothetical protein [Acinetobacter baumannii]MDK2327496.1 hypothetical protein [Acinetobacter baumannii]
MKKIVIYFFLFFILLNLQGCNAERNNKKVFSQPELYTLNFGVEGEKKFKSYMQTGVDQQSAGMSFFDLTWEPPHLANIKIDLGEHSFVIKNAFSAMGTRIDYTQQNEGIQIIDVTAGLNKEEFVSQEQAHMAYKELFSQLEKAGWKQYFFPGLSRISKKDNMKVMIEDGLIIDPYNFLTLTEWTDFFNKKPTVAVRLYNHGIFLEMSIDKTKSENDKKQYMLRYSMETIRYNTKNSIKDGYKLSGQELKTAFNERMKYNEKQRAKVENHAKKEGFHIDESYQDPDVWQYVK